MIGVSTEYRQQLIAGNRNWVISVPVFLSGNNTNTPDFTLTNAEIWDNGIVLDEAVSSDSSFDLGAAIVGSLKVVIDNISGNFSSYDFYGAKLTLWLGVEGDEDNGTQRMYRMGFFVVDTPSYNGSLITLNCLDNMTWFDVPFDEVTGITYPATAGTVVQAICNKVGVTLGTPTFPHYSNSNTRVLAKPEQQLNCREVLQYIAQMCCCYCKINTAGQLVLKWHDKTAITGLIDYDGGTFSTTTTPYSDGDAVDGKLFNPWEQGESIDGGTFEQLRDRAFITQNFECEVSTDDVVITGVRVRNNTSKDDDKAYDELWVDSTLEQTHPRYVLVIDNNPLITKAKAANIANIVGNTLAGLPMRGFTATSLADFSYETGDMATVVDFRGNRYYTWITHFTFTTNNSERFSCGVESIRKRSEQRYSGTVKTLAEANQNAEDALTAYDNAVKAMNELAANAVGYKEYYYPAETTALSSRVTYRYNGTTIDTTDPANPKFPNSTVVFKISGDGVFVSTSKDSQGYPIYTNGYDANSGTAILNLLYAQGLNANWIKAGTVSANYIRGGVLRLGGDTNGAYKNGSLYMYNSSDEEIGHWTRGGIAVKAGTITLGDKTGRDDDNTGVYIGSTGIALGKTVDNVPTFRVTNSGSLTAKSGYIGNGSAGWTIANTALYNGLTSLTDNSHNGTYVGTTGIRNRNGSKEVKITNGAITANSGEIGGFSITADALGDEIGSSQCVGMKSGNKLFAWNSSYATEIDFGRIRVGTGSSSSKGIYVYSSSSNNFDGDYIKYGFSDIYSSDLDDTVAWKKDISDRRLKKNIKEIATSSVRTFFDKIKPSQFKFKKEAKEDDKNHFGIIAQDVEEALEDSNLPKDGIINVRERDGIYKINYREFHGLELAGIKDLYTIVKSQQEEIDLLKREVALLKEKVGEK